MEASGPNAQQIAYWNEQAGPNWVGNQELLDAQIGALGRLTIERSHAAAGERVLDVGCGCGQTSLELAEAVGADGEVVGVDISAPMLARAEERAREAGLDHASFENADAQTHGFSRGHFDLVYSRFGVMFFENPAGAFTNLNAALRPGGRLAFVCWRPIQENPWMLVPMAAAAQHVQLPPPAEPGAPGPFSFAEQERVRGILAEADFVDLDFEPVDQHMLLGGGGGLDAAVGFLLQLGPTRSVLAEADAATVEKATAAVREALEAYMTDEGVRMPSAAWIVRARRPTTARDEAASAQ